MQSRLCNNLVVVGLHGLRYSGKSTLSRILQEYIQSPECGLYSPLSHIARMALFRPRLPHVRRFSFGDAPKEMLMAMGVPRENLYDPELKEEPIPWLNNRSARYLLQTMATEWGRDMVMPGLWSSIVDRKLQQFSEECGDEPCLAILDDVRFETECEVIRKYRSSIWRIRRSSVNVDTSHRSDQDLPDALMDGLILNNFATADELRAAVAPTFLVRARTDLILITE